MRHTRKLAKWVAGTAAIAAVALTAMTPLAARADGWNNHGQGNQQASTQQNKNNWRNIGIGSAAVGVLGLLDHNNTLALLGVAGAGYSADRYEQDRHSQSQDQSWRDQRFDQRSDRRGY
jgi:hypothetical protein